MLSKRELFLANVGQTSTMPLSLEIERAEGMYIYSTEGKQYLDLNSGISVSSLGHRHPKVVAAIQAQLDRYMHTMVYGEHVQTPQVAFAHLLLSQLDPSLQSVYFVMTGTETVELAIKLARRYTGRTKIFSCRNAYHGSTIGAESLRSDTEFTMHFQPSLAGIDHIEFNSFADLEKIDKHTAAVIMEPVQAEAGVQPPDSDYLPAVRKKCLEEGVLFVLDEIQTGFGRTGALFAHKKYEVVPDILLIGKSMGGGMPIGACVSSKEILGSIIKNPALGHITTFGGHPISASAALANLEVLLEEDIVEQVLHKEQLIRQLLQHEILAELRSSGLMMAVELTKKKYLKHVVQHTIEQGALIDYFLFNRKSFRLAPPLIISEDQIQKGCDILLRSMDYALKKYQR